MSLIKPTMDDQSPSSSAAAPQTKDAGDGLTSEKMDAEKAAQFVMQNRARLIQGVSPVMAIVDSLGTMVHPDHYAEILAEKTRQNQMRLLFTKVLDPGGKAVRAAFYDAFKQHQPQLFEKPETLCKQQLKSNLTKRLLCLSEWITNEGQKTFLNQIYTEVYITKGRSGEVNKEHEVRRLETASGKPASEETSIKLENIFKALPGDIEPVRTVMTKGVAGIGKTVLAQKYTLDWAEDKANKDIHFVFPFTFRELNLEKKKKNEYSLEELLHHFFCETKNVGICIFDEPNVVFIFDGLDECRPPLDFQNTVRWTDPTKKTTVDVLLTNLIKGNLLPKVQIWITTRPAAADQIPSDYVDRVTEMRGFNDPQKKEYFFKRFSDEQQAGEIYSHIQSSRSLHIMCHIPVFCWISAKVLEGLLSTEGTGALPKTQTAMYIHFMLVQSIQKIGKYQDFTQKHPNRNPNDAILSLGKLAFEQLKKGNLIFYEEDLTASGIDIRDAAVYSEVFTQLFGEVRGTYKDKVFCFVHLSVQEFLAALYVFITFINTGDNLLSTTIRSSYSKLFGRIYKSVKFHHLYQSAVDEALQSPNGHLDLFLRFLLGLSLESNQNLLKRLLNKTGERSHSNQKTLEYIKEKIRENPSPEKSINLFHCLNELNDHSLEEEIQQYLRSGSLTKEALSPAQWSALVFMLLSSENKLDVFDLKKYSASEKALMWLLPVVKASSRALLRGCNLSETCCEKLSSSVLTTSSSLIELDLSNNDLQDSGVKWLSEGLGSPHCTLETLRLRACNLSETCCEELSNVCNSSSSSLKEMDLSDNDLQDSGVRRLSDGLGSAHCTLETLGLSGCNVSEVGCSYLVSALKYNSHLKVLNMSFSHRGGDSEEQLRSAGQLETLSVDHRGKFTLKPGLRKYVCELTLDPNTAHSLLSLSKNNREVTCDEEDHQYPDHPDRFKTRSQVMCGESLTGRCYWEVKWSRRVDIAVTYRGINRQGDDSLFGDNDKSWCLICDGVINSYTVRHNKNRTVLPVRPSSSSRVSVYVDCSAGTVSFYTVTSDTLTHLYTFQSTFTEPLYAGFHCWVCSSVSLC